MIAGMCEKNGWSDKDMKRRRRGRRGEKECLDILGHTAYAQW